MSIDLVHNLEEPRQSLRARRIVRPMTVEECRGQEDIRWAQDDPEVQRMFCGEFVVPRDRQIVAHGRDAALVLTEAARVTGCAAEDLPLVGISDPLQDTPL